jgi:hypothetical protein
MALFSRLTRKLCTPPGGEGVFEEDYRAIQKYTGEHMPGWDNRGTPGPMQGEVEQPGVGFANDELRRVDPNWRPR